MTGELVIIVPVDSISADVFENSVLTVITLPGDHAFLSDDPGLDMTRIAVRCDKSDLCWNVVMQNDDPVIGQKRYPV